MRTTERFSITAPFRFKIFYGASYPALAHPDLRKPALTPQLAKVRGEYL